jgi:hypothetical protein
MNEKDIRDRIAQFLQKTARTVVVPASMGLGLSAAGCDHHSLQGKAADAGPDLVAQNADATTNAPDLADAAAKNDLPLIAVPYLVVMVGNDAADTAADALEAQSVDADRDATALPLDVRADISYPPPPYLVPVMAPDEQLGGTQGTSPAPLELPEKK